MNYNEVLKKLMIMQNQIDFDVVIDEVIDVLMNEKTLHIKNCKK